MSQNFEGSLENTPEREAAAKAEFLHHLRALVEGGEMSDGEQTKEYATSGESTISISFLKKLKGENVDGGPYERQEEEDFARLQIIEPLEERREKITSYVYHSDADIKKFITTAVTGDIAKTLQEAFHQMAVENQNGEHPGISVSVEEIEELNGKLQKLIQSRQ
ncbi:MAG: hypothetical protein COU09_03015 [Candidatus Harrisonbacteria bacterium CG10_big_fil_rev_8_21_14_0_10_44_23]|uniref:Uncharacterized protein n=1 Tax=Candidatus Harrisonbacteria bacterium CG10_big_fil_rev_8_21_14_0_10_44_23 TaxID=1974585 RepID=A0A2H0UPF9_9BACT|nr:MAG: hypothetical protein COU09_03015 [Candidatus Harrisonbacteria bacterium CG10_big_fil_rev_8_21_14_0_10_44_23]